MKKVKITVLRTMLNQDLAEEYGVDGLTAVSYTHLDVYKRQTWSWLDFWVC